MIDSKSKVNFVMNSMLENGYTKEQTGKVHTPIGLSIGGQTPAGMAYGGTVKVLFEFVNV